MILQDYTGVMEKTIHKKENQSFFKSIWNEKNISHRSKFAVVFFPFTLVAILTFFDWKFYPSVITLPYVLFFAIILLSACFGGAKSALYATIFSFTSAILTIYVIHSFNYQTSESFLLETLMFLIEALFLTFLINSFQQQQSRYKKYMSVIDQKNNQLQEKERELEKFMHTVIHEFKTPLAILKGYQQVLKKHLLKDDRLKDVKSVDQMERQVSLLNLRVGELISLSKHNLEANYQKQHFLINSCLITCVEDLRVAKPDFNIITEIQNHHVKVFGDFEKIYQVFSNLITNAFKYAGNGNYLKVSDFVIDGYIVFNFIDDGPGIPDQKQEHIFERYYRLTNQESDEANSLGLGLFICSEIIKAHNGKIGVQNEVGKGANFWVSLPILN